MRFNHAAINFNTAHLRQADVIASAEIVGLTHYDVELNIGDILRLQRDPNNQNDPNTVLVFKNSERCATINRHAAQILAPIFDNPDFNGVIARPRLSNDNPTRRPDTQRFKAIIDIHFFIPFDGEGLRAIDSRRATAINLFKALACGLSDNLWSLLDVKLQAKAQDIRVDTESPMTVIDSPITVTDSPITESLTTASRVNVVSPTTVNHCSQLARSTPVQDRLPGLPSGAGQLDEPIIQALLAMRRVDDSSYTDKWQKQFVAVALNQKKAKPDKLDKAVDRWVYQQRHKYKNGKLQQERVDLLNAIEFTWTKWNKE